jgi:hypothetical protein
MSQQSAQASPVERNQLRHVHYGIMVETAGPPREVDVARRVAEAEIAGDRGSDDGLDVAPIEPVGRLGICSCGSRRLFPDRLGGAGEAVVGPA